MPHEPSKPGNLIDACGTAHPPAVGDSRIVSLVPSLTELLFDLGLGEAVVGRTAFCVHPAPHVGRVRSVGGTKQVNWDKLRRARPTHVLVNIDETPRDLADAMAAEGWCVVVTHPIDVRDNLTLYRLIGGLFGRVEAAEALCSRLERACERLAARVAGLPPRRVLYLIWRDPWMTVSADTYISRMLALANWHTIGSDTETRYPTVDLSEARLADVDRVLFSSEPFPFKWRHIEAFAEAYPVHARKAAWIDAEMVSWYGSRAVAGVQYLEGYAATLA